MLRLLIGVNVLNVIDPFEAVDVLELLNSHLFGFNIFSVPHLVHVPALLALHVRDEVVNVRLVAERLGARPDTSSPCAPSVELDGGAELAVGADDASVWVAGVCDGCGWVCRHFLSGFYSSNGVESLHIVLGL